MVKTKMKAVIISGGNPPPEELLFNQIKDADLIIGADSGCDTLIEYNIVPNYCIGDFDSIKQDISVLIEKGSKKIEYNKQKDETDSKLAFDLAIEKGADKIIALGMTGTRLDHTIANFGLLEEALNRDISMEILDYNNRIFLINKSQSFLGKKGQTVSFLAYKNEVKNLNISNAKYNLNDYILQVGDCLTISNEFSDEDIEISFSKGILMIVYAKD